MRGSSPGDGREPRCVTVVTDNRAGTSWQYSRFDLPFDCHPPFMTDGWALPPDTTTPMPTPTTFGCEMEVFPEYRAGWALNTGASRGSRWTNFTNLAGC